MNAKQPTPPQDLRQAESEINKQNGRLTPQYLRGGGDNQLIMNIAAKHIKTNQRGSRLAALRT